MCVCMCVCFCVRNLERARVCACVKEAGRVPLDIFADASLKTFDHFSMLSSKSLLQGKKIVPVAA